MLKSYKLNAEGFVFEFSQDDLATLAAMLAYTGTETYTDPGDETIYVRELVPRYLATTSFWEKNSSLCKTHEGFTQVLKEATDKDIDDLHRLCFRAYLTKQYHKLTAICYTPEEWTAITNARNDQWYKENPQMLKKIEYGFKQW
jgi:hypothetical protein